jgi:hypothetical protein
VRYLPALSSTPTYIDLQLTVSSTFLYDVTPCLFSYDGSVVKDHGTKYVVAYRRTLHHTTQHVRQTTENNNRVNRLDCSNLYVDFYLEPSYRNVSHN